ncbi:MAG: cation diffusion facilitator family transporter [Chloroflexota bacterium]
MTHSAGGAREPHAHEHDDHGHDHPHPHGDDGHADRHDHALASHARTGTDGDRDHGHAHGEHGHAHGEHDDHDHDHGEHGHGAGLWASIKHSLTPHSHDHSEAIQSAEEATSEGIRAAWISLGGMALTAFLQIGIVAISGSIALLADTVHNFGHLVTTIPLIIAFRIGRRPATKRYPFGYRRAEDLVGLLIAGMILLTVVIIIWESVRAIFEPREVGNLGWVFAAGIVGFLGNEIVAIYRIRIGRKIGSAALIAEGNHARADGLTSIAVAVGITGVWLGFPQADPIVGLLIAVVILGILVSSVRSVLRRLMDGVDDGLVDDIHTVAAAVPGVEYVDQIRARWSGHRLQAQITLGCEGTRTVADGHELAERVHHDLLHAIPNLDDVVVHVHPAFDGVTPPAAHELTGHHASPRARHDYREVNAAT